MRGLPDDEGITAVDGGITVILHVLRNWPGSLKIALALKQAYIIFDMLLEHR
jgi:hypothetical protein